MTIHLPEDVERGILEAVQSGRFASVDAAMAEAGSLLLGRLQGTETQSPVSSGAAHESKPIWDEALELTADVPEQEWDKLPSDLAEQHDHYIYGTPKRPSA
jgi:Arc/MetJ-type ribon-helix-helix transcriptional regulator